MEDGDSVGDAVGAAELGTNVMCAALGYIDGKNVGNVVDGDNDKGESVDAELGANVV